MVKSRQATRLLWHQAHPIGAHLFVRMVALSVPGTKEHPEGVKYSFTLVDKRTAGRVFAIDNYGGHGHHMHIGNKTFPYEYTGLLKVKEDFWAYVEDYKRD